MLCTNHQSVLKYKISSLPWHFHLGSSEYPVHFSTSRKMCPSIYLVISVMIYIPQSSRNHQVSFSFIVIQIYLCKPELLALIGENDLLFYSHFHIAQVKEDVIIQFTYTQHCFKLLYLKWRQDWFWHPATGKMVYEIWGNLLSHSEIRMWTFYWKEWQKIASMTGTSRFKNNR